MAKRNPISLKDSYLAIENTFGRISEIKTKQIRQIWGDSWNWDLTDPENRVKRGTFSLDWGILGDTQKSPEGELVATASPVESVVPDTPKSPLGESVESVSFIPDVDATYVRF